MKTSENAATDGSDSRLLREVRYNLTEMLAELPSDREALKLGHELIAQDEISRVFKFRKRKNDSGK